ncbi:unnamed protein product [Adineta steineri]|uniref:AIG1-type G domain-containing protein n=1 Tax=Adineta steineri TaxID=433720 RepID=A0A819NLS9_9BILA|nr:unnamed protein product [Adineta steineri]CAF0758851.1 unnamed protein product [Adineta steineri]CAF3996950.1 unnamed protein product [Adineta steineri]CAF4040418.1 unnamed protein product [Adineta steineri]
MTTSNNSVGAIILGNSGVGKSFLANVILGREAFKHEYQPNAVTLKTEYQKSSINGQTYAIYNIPGLIESDQERIELNKREIDLAFQQHPNAVVFYVFSTNHGRIKNEDVVAFNAINAAYPLSQKSLIVVVNGVNPKRPPNYDTHTVTTLTTLLKMHLPYMCFVKQINEPSEQELLHQQLIQTITRAVPKVHHKEQKIDLQAAEISKLTKEIAEFQKHIEQDREKHRLEVEKLKKEFDEKERRQKAEQEEFRRKVDKEQEESRKKVEEQSKMLKDAQRTSAIKTIPLIYLLISDDYEQQKFRCDQFSSKIISIFKNEKTLITRWVLDMALKFRIAGDQEIEMGNKETARSYFEQGAALYQHLTKMMENKS